MRYIGEDYEHGEPERIGVLLTNLGTPDAPEKSALKRYLAEFLWDPRVVEIPRPVWWLILNGIILRTRPARSAAAYREVWTDEGSPLLRITQRQCQGLQERFRSEEGSIRFAIGMRYGNPSIAQGLETLKGQGCRRILALPLYPQYSASTTGSTFDAVADTLKHWRWLPELRFNTQYHDQPGYIQALAESVRNHWATHGRGQRLLFSFHGVPKRYFLSGDPYHCQCHKTARLVAEALGLSEAEWQLAFQSRFGREEWLRPYTDETVKQLPSEGITELDVICPGFSADCLETLEEIESENRDYFLEAGGEKFQYIPALNDNPSHLDFLADLVVDKTQDWRRATVGGAACPFSPDTSRAKALALGAER